MSDQHDPFGASARRRGAARRDAEPDAPLEWERAAEAASPSQTLTVGQLSERVRALLERGFPGPLWLVGETTGIKKNGGKPYVFFTLVDQEVPAGGKRAAVEVVLWQPALQRLFGPRGKLRGVMQLEDGLVLRVLVRPNWYAAGGRLSFAIEDVDPDATLGSLDRQRRELLQRLAAEGATERNKAVPLPEVPQLIGLVTSLESAAYHDVLSTFAAAGLGLRILACDARVQGDDTAASVCAALRTLVRLGPDCILIARGGGSRIDLAGFDREEIARAIADCPCPVLTGIGHEIDLSVADAVAHRSFKTPTALAEFLVARAHAGLAAAEASWAAIAACVDRGLSEARRDLLGLARGTRQAAVARLADARAEVRRWPARLGEVAASRLHAEAGELDDAARRTGHGRHVLRLERLATQLGERAARLPGAGEALLARREQSLVAAEDRARLLDPRRVLQRGYALLRRADGSLLKDAASAVPGEPLAALLRDGELPLTAGRREGA